MSRDEVADVRRIERDLVERTPARLRRLLDHGLADDEARADRRERAGTGAEPETSVARPAERVAEEERDCSERKMDLARERNRCERRTCECEPPARSAPRSLEGPQRKRQEDGDRSEQMADALLDAVGRDRKCEPACECRAAGQAELEEPSARRET